MDISIQWRCQQDGLAVLRKTISRCLILEYFQETSERLDILSSRLSEIETRFVNINPITYSGEILRMRLFSQGENKH